ncbi:MAG: HigA family addiction module antidote protein [Gammaproteobacteria bacterium]|nr:HigA family addiction module antidote protein [Gammaproteobacteria bacterium]MYD79446.1 HigA family addiction module antidote protein [Gammaproteobacteria bacterium]
MRPAHPGEILQNELWEIGLSSEALACELGVLAQLVTSILEGRQAVSADTAMRLARLFGTTPKMWLNLQQIRNKVELTIRQRNKEEVVA